jgi:2-oxoglutarate dehydrogenase E2 component (dihydrolipoamide succinyltransferase)
MWSISKVLGSLSRAPAKVSPSSAWYSVQVLVPSLGESITDGTIASVLKKSGDSVVENETIAQIETDKVTIDIKAPADGTVLGIVVQEQDTVVPGQLVATLDDAAAQVVMWFQGSG